MVVTGSGLDSAGAAGAAASPTMTCPLHQVLSSCGAVGGVVWAMIVHMHASAQALNLTRSPIASAHQRLRCAQV